MFSGFSQGAKNLFKFPTVKRSALSLKAEKASSAQSGMGQTFKVVAGMKEIRVHSAEVSISSSLQRNTQLIGEFLAFTGSARRSLSRSSESKSLLNPRQPSLLPFSLDLHHQSSSYSNRSFHRSNRTHQQVQYR